MIPIGQNFKYKADVRQCKMKRAIDWAEIGHTFGISDVLLWFYSISGDYSMICTVVDNRQTSIPRVHLPISKYWRCIKRRHEKEAPRCIVRKTSCPNCCQYTSAKMVEGLFESAIPTLDKWLELLISMRENPNMDGVKSVTVSVLAHT